MDTMLRTPVEVLEPRRLASCAVRSLEIEDPELHQLLADGLHAQRDTLAMVAGTSIAPPSVLACAGSSLTDSRGIERLAVSRAMAAFGARYADVRPHSGDAANLSVYFGLLEPGDTIMGMDGGHLTHGSPSSITSRHFTTVAYGLNGVGRIDYARARELALRHRPKLIVCGSSSYPRVVDFARFRAVADEVGALLLADISHIAGLVVAGEHPSPIDHAHITTTSTYQQLGGPRGGLIMMGRDADTPLGQSTLRHVMERAVPPICQRTPNPAAIAANARVLRIATSPDFRAMARRIRRTASALAAQLICRGHEVLTHGTDNHLVMLDVRRLGLTGAVAESALVGAGIVVDRARLPWDVKPSAVGSGLRLGTNTLAMRGLGEVDMAYCADLLDTVLHATSSRNDTDFHLPEHIRGQVAAAVAELCRAFPLPGYP